MEILTDAKAIAYMMLMLSASCRKLVAAIPLYNLVITNLEILSDGCGS